MRTPTPDTDDCQEKWKAFTVKEQLLFAYKLARLLEQQRDEARYTAYGLAGGSIGRRTAKGYAQIAVWGDQYKRMVSEKMKKK